MERAPDTPVEISEVVTTAAENTSVEAEPGCAQQGELDSNIPTLAEQGAKLLKIAAVAARADAIDRGAYSRANVYNTLATAPVSVANSIVGAVAGYPSTVMGLLFATTLVSHGEWLRGCLIGPRARTSLTLPDGYSLQCLRVAEKTTSVPDGRVAVAIHPREYGNESEPEALTKERLAQALEVVAATEIADKSYIKNVIIPESVARRAALPYTGNRQYADVVRGISAQEPQSPYAEGERAVILPANRAAEVAEYLRGDYEPILLRVMSEVASKYPAKRETLTPANPLVIKVLYGLLERAALAGGGIRVKRPELRPAAVIREVDGEPKKCFFEAWNGDWVTGSEDVSTTIDATNRYNPRLIQRTAQSGEEVGNSDLRTLTGGDATMADIIRKLNEGSYDNMQLLRVALELLEKREKVQQEEPAATTALPRGSEATLVEAAPRQPNANALRMRFVSRVAVASTVICSGFNLLMGLWQGLENKMDAVPATTSALSSETINVTPLFRVEDHGLDTVHPYWPQYVNYVYDPQTDWKDDPNVPRQELALAEFMGREDVPYLTVTTLAADATLSLPRREGTAIAAIRAFDVNNSPIPVKLFLKADGEAIANVTEPDKGYYRIEYDLVADDSGEWAISPAAPIRIESKEEVANPESYPGAQLGMAGLAGYIANGFTYDNSLGHMRETANRRGNRNDFVRYVYDTARCQCAQCNTAVAMVHSDLYPDKDAAFVEGFLADRPLPPNGHMYLTSDRYHAWLNDGQLIDATARKTDVNSHVNQKIPTESTDQLWDSQSAILHLRPRSIVEQAEAGPDDSSQYHKTLLLSLAGMLAAGLVATEMRHRVMRRVVHSYSRWDRWVSVGMDIDPRDAVRILGWEAYGTMESRIPHADKGRSYNGERIDNIPTETLKRVARGEVRTGSQLSKAQTRGLRMAARAILHRR